jgi:hypothetical protein
LGKAKAVNMRAMGLLLARVTRRAALTVAGFVLVCLGLAGLVLPVLPGWVLIIAGFAVLSREYSWAASGLAFARRQAAQGGHKLRSLARRRRRGRFDFAEPSGEVIIDLTGDQDEPAHCASNGSNRSRASNIG